MAKQKKESTLCFNCGQVAINTTNAYKSNSYVTINGRMLICKQCSNNMYLKYLEKHKDSKTAIFLTCRKLDVPFVVDLFDLAVTQLDNMKKRNEDNKEYKSSPLFGYYMSKVYTSVSSRYGSPKIFDDGEELTIRYGILNNAEEIDEDENKEFLNLMVKKWGAGAKLKYEDYLYLENEYTGMVLSYGEPKDYSSTMFFKDIATINLEIKKKRESGTDYKKDIELRNKIIGEANISPIDPNSAEKTPPLGLVTKMLEDSDPIFLQDDKYKDVDKLGELGMQVVGQLAKMEGKRNKSVSRYEEYLRQHEIDFDKLQEELSDLGDDSQLDFIDNLDEFDDDNIEGSDI